MNGLEHPNLNITDVVKNQINHRPKPKGGQTQSGQLENNARKVEDLTTPYFNRKTMAKNVPIRTKKNNVYNSVGVRDSQKQN